LSVHVNEELVGCAALCLMRSSPIVDSLSSHIGYCMTDNLAYS